MKIAYVLAITFALGASTSLFGDPVKDFRNKKTVGICYAGKEDVDMQQKRKDFMACEKTGLAECNGLKAGKFLKCRKAAQNSCVEEVCEL